MPPEYRARIEAGQPRLAAVAREHYGLTLNRGPFGIDSRTALIGAKYAEEQQGDDTLYHQIVLRAYWQEARDISEVSVLRELAETAGLDGDAFEQALAKPLYEMRVHQDIETAMRYGIGGVPAMIFERQYLVSGAQPYEALADVVEQLSEASEGS